MPCPGRPNRTLIQIHAHNQGLAKPARQLHEAHPSGTVSRSQANQQLAIVRLGRGDDSFGVGDGFSDRFLDKYVRSGLEGAYCEVGVRVRPGVYRNDIGFHLCERLAIVGGGIVVDLFQRDIGGVVEAGIFLHQDIFVGNPLLQDKRAVAAHFPGIALHDAEPGETLRIQGDGRPDGH